jgi:thiol:disulfide interchange protein DsbC
MKKCENPVARDYHLGESMGVHGTPALYTEQGDELGGYTPAPELIRLFQAGG